MDHIEAFVRLEFVVHGPPVVLKNSRVIVTRGRHPRLVYGKRLAQWMKMAVAALEGQWDHPPLAESIHIAAAVVSYVHDRRRRDLDNSLGAPLDALTKAGILTDDSQIKSVDGSRIHYDKDNPRVEITLTPYRYVKHRRGK